MKKYLLLFTSAALLLVGCAKEQIVDLQEGEMTNVTFTANLESGVATKAFADGDGNGTNVNRCIMEIYYGDTFYKRLVQPVETVGSKKVATFANVPVVAGKEYQILFWADNGSGTEGKDDQYYATTNLKTVTVKDAFIDALKSGNNDKLDAFFGNEKRTFTQQNDEVPILLKRPFAQLNVITTDVDTGKAVISAALLPEKVSVSYTAADSINVATGEVSGTKAYTYEASVYGKYNTWDDVKSRGELTLSMDYIFAEAEKRVIDVTFKTKNGENVVMTHNLTNLPYQRNYRTNVKGDLLTVGGTWKATIDAGWTTPDYDIPFYVASSIQDAQNYINTTNTEKSKAVDLTKATIQQSDVNQQDGTIHFILKTSSPQDLVNFTLPAIPETIENCEGWTIEYEPQYPTKNVGVNAPANTKVKIFAPTSHVNVTGTSYTEITALTGDNTLVIPQGVTVDSLIIKKGAVEIHGAVSALEVSPEEYSDGSRAKVVFRACEGLSADVFAAIKGEDHDYIDPRYCAIENETTPKTYNIVLNAVAEINGVTYPTLAEAVEAATAGAVVKLVKDINLNAQVEVSEKEIFLDLNGKTIEYKGAQLINSGILLVHNGAGLTINGKGFIKSGTGAYAAIALTKSGDNANNPAKLTVNGGDIEGYYYGIVGNGTRHNTQIVINGGTITSTDNEATAIYHPQNGTLTINGGVIKGENGIYIKSGTVAKISKATIEATGAKGEYKFNGSGFEHTGDALIVDNCNYPGGRPTVKIGDATLISANGFQVGAYFSAPETGISDIYSTEHKNFTVPAGYEWNEGGKLVKKPISVTSQNEFNNAISSATTGDIIEIKATGEYTVPNIPNNVTIKGGDGVVFNCVGSGSIASIPNGATFENVTMNMGQTEYHGFHQAGYILLKNCTINGYYKTYGNTRFEDCVFNQDVYAYCLNAYGDDLDVVNCTFNNKGKAFYCYNEGNPAHYTVNFTGCTFNVTYDSKAKSQIFVKNNVAGQKYTVNISGCQIGTSNKTIEEYKTLELDPDLTNGKGDLRLWNVEEGSAKGQYVKVTLEGETVYSYGSLE